jgi:hypothetical protein
MTFDFTQKQLSDLGRHLRSGTDSTIRIGGYVFRYAFGHLHFANSGTPEKYYFDTPVEEILALIDAAIRAD